MLVRYTGEDPILLAVGPLVYEVSKNDEIELETVPDLPNFEACEEDD